LGLREGGALKRAAVLAIAASVLSCRSTEQELVHRFLDASARKDGQTVALLSMVSFPAEITDYRVVTLGSERREPYRLPALRARVEEAEDRRDDQYKAFSEFRRANYDELLRLQRQRGEDPTKTFEGRQGDLQEQWDAFREEQNAVVKSLHEAQLALEWEIRTIQKSLQTEMAPDTLEGETLSKVAFVRVTTKAEGERAYDVTLTRYDLKNSFGAVVPTRWIVTGVEPAS
jgi:hypothetical protein